MIGIYPDFGNGGFWHGWLIVETFFPRRAPNFYGGVIADILMRASSQSIPDSHMSPRGYVRIRRHWNSRDIGPWAYDFSPVGGANSPAGLWTSVRD